MRLSAGFSNTVALVAVELVFAAVRDRGRKRKKKEMVEIARFHLEL